MAAQRAGRTAGRASRPSITLEAVTAAALRTLQRDGLEALSMRRLADELSIQAPSLYWYVRNKEELLDLLADALLADLRLDPLLREDGDWQTELRDMMRAYRKYLLGKRDSGKVLAGRLQLGPHFLHHAEVILGPLRRAGFSEQDTAYSLYVLTQYVQGFVLHETSPLSADVARGTDRMEFLGEVRERLAKLPAEEYPNVVAVGDQLARPDIEARFDYGLDRLLDGLRARLDGAGGTAEAPGRSPVG
ncbi:TetR/AcrR family transcriptional regulator C-terminal domain-containing protein [Streptomyces sp. CSDS2]|uniref:TetR/AcrR family transcriptional regulator C-terminal domain-containing protein n=1 Tax=Streptomyces sp. CSDS2 TaxID=3055051 RepID=UPI0025B21F8E|nr:TetR/AcrR family transcriptional regulator C-terminal domain-containing protein [Streptomyces sp. CSDS2]MDN3265596.1 TetR/AcrR family transcriptional regulator C-terminal domain-containing protein [Streptomyces sp. CSDS2]